MRYSQMSKMNSAIISTMIIDLLFDNFRDDSRVWKT